MCIRDSLQTPLDAQTVPLLEHYLELSQAYESLLTTPTVPIDHTPSLRKRVKEILELSQQSTVSTDPTASVREELHSLSISNPTETLQGIKDFMRIEDSFSEAKYSDSSSSSI